jgi:hypothetical protein
MEMLDRIGYQIAQPFARVVAGAEVMHVAKGTLDRVGAGTIGRQKQQLNLGVLGQPLLNNLCLMDLIADIPQTLDGICIIFGVGRISSWEENLWNKPTAVKP